MDEIENIINIVSAMAEKIADKYNISKDFISPFINNDKSLSVWITELTTGKKTKLAFKVSLKGKKGAKYVSFTARKSIIKNISLPENVSLKYIDSDIANVIVNFPTGENNYITFVHDILDYSVNTFEPSDKFGCCSKYIECSNAKKCLHENLFYAKACFYRKNLESGKIFYGENKNI